MRRIIALDIHKRETQACVMDPDGTILEEKRFPTTKKDFRRALKKHPDSHAIIETVGFNRPVAEWLLDQGHDVRIANTSRIPKPAVKTDKKDARHLANLFRANLLPESYLAPEHVQRWRDIARQRHFLGQESSRLKGKIMHDLLKHGHFLDKNPVENEAGRTWLRSLEIPEVSSCLAMYEVVHAQLREFEKKIAAEITDVADAQRLWTIPGVGLYTALLVLGEVGDFRRFKDKDAVASYAGFSIRQEQSGDHDKRGHITKQGNELLRWALVEAARNHLQQCPESFLSQRHRRLAEKKGSKRAVVATARVLLTVMYTMIVKNEEFRVNPLEARA